MRHHSKTIVLYEVLKGRKVVLFPDAEGWEKWNSKARVLQKSLGSPVLVSDWLEKLARKEERIEGIDLADVLGKVGV